MNPSLQTALTGLLGVALVAYVTWLNNRQQNKRGEGDQEMKRIEVVQAAQAAEIARLQARVGELEGSLGDAMMRLRLAMAYCRTLLRFIDRHCAAAGEPPPDPPVGLSLD